MLKNMQVHIVEQALPTKALTAVCNDAYALADCKNFWVPKERIRQGPSACSTPSELAVALLYEHVAHLLPADWQGAEYWVQVYKPGIGLGFHFDKDEHLLESTGQMLHPIWSSILYLTGSDGSRARSLSSGSSLHSQRQQQQQHKQQQRQQHPHGKQLPDDWDGFRQAPTVILEQLFSQDLGRPVPSTPHRSMLVWPLKGRYCVFDGRLGHGVLDSCSSTTRATLLVNWWIQCPLAVEQLPDEAIEQQQLTRLDSNCVRDLITTSNKNSSSHGKSSKGRNSSSNSSSCSNVCDYTDGTKPSTGDVTEQVAAINLTAYSNNTAIGPAQGDYTRPQQQEQKQHHQKHEFGKQYKSELAGEVPAQQQWQQQRQQQQQVPHVCVKLNAGDVESGMQLVDDVLARSGIHLTGPQAVSAVQFEHPGFMLCPIEDPSTAQDDTDSNDGCSNSSGSSGSNDGSNGSDGSDGGSSGSKLQTLGAFVSTVLLDDGSSSCCGGSETGSESASGHQE